MVLEPEAPDRFRPPPGLGNPHVQTLLARALRSRAPAAYVRTRLDTPDGDFVDLDVWAGPVRAPRGVCLLLHGLEGSARSGYVVATAGALARAGILPVALNFRSCSGEPNRRAASYHSGHTDDIELALDWIAASWAGLPRFAVGFSLGGNALLVLLGRTGGRPVAAAAAVSVPYDLSACATALERNRLYSRYFLRSLREKALRKAARFPDLVPPDAAAAATVREFDELFTAPLGGFADAEDYYRRCSAGRYVAGVAVPTLLVQAADDPLVPFETFPAAQLAGGAFEVDVTSHGGHVGFVDARHRVGADGWLERRVARFFEGIARGTTGV